MGTQAVLTSTHNLCFEQKYEKYQNFLSENVQFLGVRFSIYLNRRVFVMNINEDTQERYPVLLTLVMLNKQERSVSSAYLILAANV